VLSIVVDSETGIASLQTKIGDVTTSTALSQSPLLIALSVRIYLLIMALTAYRITLSFPTLISLLSPRTTQPLCWTFMEVCICEKCLFSRSSSKLLGGCMVSLVSVRLPGLRYRAGHFRPGLLHSLPSLPHHSGSCLLRQRHVL
jgi:hypothetical protein